MEQMFYPVESKRYNIQIKQLFARVDVDPISELGPNALNDFCTPQGT